MSQWYYSDYDRNRHGPVEASDLAELHGSGQLLPATLVWKEGWAQWKPWSEAIGEVIPGAGRPAEQTANFATARGDAPASAGHLYAVAEARSPYAPPVASVDMSQAVVHGGEVVYAGFRKRLAAYAIDSFLVGIAFYAVFMVALIAGGVGMGGLMNMSDATLAPGFLLVMGLAYLSYPLISGLYYVLMESSGHQATLGKLAVGIKVTDSAGRQLSRGSALARWASHLLNYLTLYIGYLMIAFTDRKRGLHDMVVDSLVVDQYAFTAHPERQRRELGPVTVVILVLAGLFLLGYIGLVAAFGVIGAMAGAGAG